LILEDVESNKSGGAMPEEEYKPRIVNYKIDEKLLKTLPRGSILHAHKVVG